MLMTLEKANNVAHCKLTAAQVHAYQAAKVQHFVTDDKVAPYYFQWCEATSRPYIRVYAKRKYAALGLEMTYGPDGEWIYLSAAAQQQAWAILDRYKQPPCWRSVAHQFGGWAPAHYESHVFLSRLLLTQAPALARELWALALAEMQARTNVVDFSDWHEAEES